ncbi:MAG: GNAT family N-acetyltransferase [Cyanobacteria bacterium P01_G01_bin.67]
MINVRQAPIEKRYILQNMWIAYAHEVSEYHDDLPNIHGLMGEKDDSYEPETMMAEWWEYPGRAFAYFIYVDDRLAGFALIAAPPLVDGDANWELTDFFLFHAYRGKGIGSQAAKQLFDLFSGSWQLSAMNEHHAALSFWQKVLPTYTKNISTNQKTVDNNISMTEFVFTKS